ncbi:peptidyl-tRNA hydrolase [Sporormia fimetaria CBS 119925]|uniref:peptidyl-tRNA hydrolase n=1 Tax=Sporormia fimetaria CBS 119925 TaxID=1340428 RepID=A0A6A6VKJ7_9PLEO|nr:peptidyl-tRNA hydrolase [Sporormia fimetaria CBS 119925]
MSNASTRAHVGRPGPTPASAMDIAEKYPDSDTEHQARTAAKSHCKKKGRTRDVSENADIPLTGSNLEEHDPEPVPAHLKDEFSDPPKDSPRLSRREKRKLKKQPDQNAHITTSDASSNQSLGQPLGLLTSSSNSLTTPANAGDTSSLSIMAIPGGRFPLLVCSLGNPGTQYARTLHSTGHMILENLQRANFEPWTKGLSGLYAAPAFAASGRRLTLTGFKSEAPTGWMKGQDDFTLWQSQKFMNVSGPSVAEAWKRFAANQRAQGLEPRLVVVHDELEAALGQVSLKAGSASPRGHNGLKSVQKSLGSLKWWRIGVGIGRPESRDPNVVSKYVLRKMSNSEYDKIYAATQNVLTGLRRVSEGRV